MVCHLSSYCLIPCSWSITSYPNIYFGYDLTDLISDPQAGDNNVLAEFGYVIHPVLGDILCKSCQAILNLKEESSAINHIKTHHPDIKPSKSAKEMLKSELDRCTYHVLWGYMNLL